MAEQIEKGSRVTITKGRDKGHSGVVFWEGKSKFGPGKRYGIKADDGETYWANEGGLELLEGGPEGEAKGEPDKATQRKPDKKPDKKKPPFKPAATLKALKRYIKDYKDKKIEAELAKIPEQERATFLWEQLKRGGLEGHSLVSKATAGLLHKVPLEEVIAALRALSERSEAYFLPEVGEDVVYLLHHADLGDEGHLRQHEAELPLPLRQALWMARGRAKIKGEPVPDEIRQATIEALPGHALSGRMRRLTLGQVIDSLKIPASAIREPTFEAIKKSKNKVRIPALGCPLFALPFEEMKALKGRLDVRYLSAHYLTWWLEARKKKLPEESLDQSVQILGWMAEVVPKKVKDHERRWILEAIEAGARALAERHVEEGQPVPEALLETVGRHTRDVEPWMPVFLTLPPKQQEKLRLRLLRELEAHLKPQLLPLELALRGEEILPQMIAELEEGVKKSNSVSVDNLLVPLGKLGEPAIEPLAERIEVLTKALNPAARPHSEGYKPRRIVIALRCALAVALGEVGRGGGAIEERYYAYLDPSPPTLFEGNDDFPYSFLNGLCAAQALFEAMPEAKVRAWIARWRASGTSYVEERLKRVLPNHKKKLLRGAPSLAEQIEALVEESGLLANEPLYLLSTRTRRSKKSKKGKKSEEGGPKGGPLMRLLGTPKGLSRERWPSAGGELYEPVFVLDLEVIPELKPLYPGARAICLLVDRPEEGFEDSVVLGLSEEECAAGVEGGRPFTAERVVVPKEAFEPSTSGALRTIRKRIGEAEARALGRPFFIQQDPHPGDGIGFVLQYGERFGDLNLGDSGTMYVYSREAFWECH